MVPRGAGGVAVERAFVLIRAHLSVKMPCFGSFMLSNRAFVALGRANPEKRTRINDLYVYLCIVSL